MNDRYAELLRREQASRGGLAVGPAHEQAARGGVAVGPAHERAPPSRLSPDFWRDHDRRLAAARPLETAAAWGGLLAGGVLTLIAIAHLVRWTLA
jgi:hypothetical protein